MVHKLFFLIDSILNCQLFALALQNETKLNWIFLMPKLFLHNNKCLQDEGKVVEVSGRGSIHTIDCLGQRTLPKSIGLIYMSPWVLCTAVGWLKHMNSLVLAKSNYNFISKVCVCEADFELSRYKKQGETRGWLALKIHQARGRYLTLLRGSPIGHHIPFLHCCS